jgi:acyl-CoA synthetase (AMP-forming)/AMP-acid ligase II
MLGYWNNDVATAAAFRRDRWLHTGDISTGDEQGGISLASRRSDLIIRGGENAYPTGIEAALTEHASVAECLVLGSDHPDFGQEVVVVHAGDPGTVDKSGLEKELAELAYFNVPTHWRCSPSRSRETPPARSSAPRLRPNGGPRSRRAAAGRSGGCRPRPPRP